MVKTAIIGLGYFGPNLLRNFAAQPNCEMAYACDLSETNLAASKARYPAIEHISDASIIFNDPSIELVLIATPTSSHMELATKALEAGKHVLVEKPMTDNPEGAKKLNDLAAAQGKLIMVDHTFVYAPAVQKMAEMAKNGELGDLLYFESTRLNLGLIQPDVNALWDLAIHDLSILGACMNLEDVTHVIAHGSAHIGTQEENVHLHLTFKSGFAAHIHVSWLSPVKVRHTMLGGNKAMVIFDDTHPSEKLRVYDRGIDKGSSEDSPFQPLYRSGDIRIPALANTENLAIEAAHVLACVEGTETPHVSGKDAENIIRILARAQESLRNGSVSN